MVTFLDFIVMGIIVVFALIGVFKGFVKTLFSLSKKLITFLGSYLLVGPIRNLITPTVIGEKINTYILNWVVNRNDVLFNITNPTEADYQTMSDSLGVPKFLVNIIKGLFSDAPEGVTLGQAVANTLTYYILTVICFIFLVILLSIIVKIASLALNSLMETRVLKPLNRVLGLCVGIVIGTFIVSLCLLFLSALGNMFDGVNTFIVNTINPTEESFNLTRWLYNNNLLVIILENFLRIDDITKLLS